MVREIGRRRLGMRHFDVQLMGGMVLHEGKIAEMATGEGKTLVATLPAVLNGLTGRGVHIVTVNDYLARRDAQWMGPIYHQLGLSVSVIQHEASFIYDPAYVPSDSRFLGLRPCQRREAYLADITYGTNNEFGFDYLRDNMRFSLEELVQRELHYAIVDEVDSILIDEARTPLIISGPTEESTDLYYKVDRIIPRLTRAATITEGKLHEIEEVRQGDYIVDEKAKTVTLTEAGVARCEQLLAVGNLYDPQHIDTLHHIHQGLRAHALFQKDVDYVAKDGQIIIVDEFTGRLMPGRRWSDGLHQAIEAKEGLRIQQENQTLATITFQNYFRMYDKLAGMTGTADTEAAEFAKIYKLDVTVVPTNRTLVRVNNPDVVYKTEREKFDAVVQEIKELHEKGRPILIGTVSIEKSERLSKLLKKGGVPDHQVLNAKYHEKEAEIVAQAGRMGAVTIATNMAGRGTDILLGGNPEFLARETLRKRGVDPATVSDEERARALEEARRITDKEHRARRRAGRPPHPRHGAARVPARRQPAPRPLGAPGRPGILALLPLPRGRPPADLRLRADPEDHGPPRDGGRGADRARPGVARDPDRPEARRGAPLRDPQAPPRVRRRHEQAARGGVRDAPRDPPGREPGGDGPRVDGRDARRHRRHLRGRGRAPGGLGSRRARGGRCTGSST